MLDEIIKMYCSLDERRPKLLHPHNDDGVIVATDAHILIVAPEKYFTNKYETVEKFPNYKAIMPIEEKPFARVNIERCYEIFANLDSQSVYADCDNCDGSGEAICHCCGGESKCEECDGNGKTTTKIGDRYARLQSAVYFNNVLFDGAFIKLMCDTAKVLDEPIMVNVLISDKTCLFTIGECKIVPMPIAYNDGEDIIVHRPDDILITL